MSFKIELTEFMLEVKMNLNLFQLASADRSVRMVIQKKPDGGFLMGISNGKEKPLICQGNPETICRELEQKLEGYLAEIQRLEIAAKLNEVSVDSHEPVGKTPAPLSLNLKAQSNNINELEQDEFEFGF